MQKLYEFTDRRDGEMIETRLVDEALEKVYGSSESFRGMKIYDKLQCLDEAGIICRGLEYIETSLHGTDEIDNVQVDFNYPEDTFTVNLNIEEVDGEKLLKLRFFPKDGDGVITKLFKEDGTEVMTKGD